MASNVYGKWAAIQLPMWNLGQSNRAELGMELVLADRVFALTLSFNSVILEFLRGVVPGVCVCST